MINAGRIFVLPSSYEGHPKTLLEAMACGAAVIGTDVPGIREVIEDGRTGLLCAPTAAALRDAIERLLSDEPLRRRLGGHARPQLEMTARLERGSADRRVGSECVSTWRSRGSPYPSTTKTRTNTKK